MSYPRLRNRQMQIPNGMTFYLPEVKWRANRGQSFQTIANQLYHVVRSNPALAVKNKWPTDMLAIEDWVDRYNASLCLRMGWTDYIVDDAPGTSPKMSPQHLRESLKSVAAAVARTKALVAGARTLMEWDESGEPPVPSEQALDRATACTKCPHNRKEDLTAWFTVPASELIRRRVAKAQQRNLTTPRDDDLNICDVCFCPLKLKVQVPLDWIEKRLDADTRAKLLAVPGCWVGKEIRARTVPA